MHLSISPLLFWSSQKSRYRINSQSLFSGNNNASTVLVIEAFLAVFCSLRARQIHVARKDGGLVPDEYVDIDGSLNTFKRHKSSTGVLGDSLPDLT